MKNLGFEYLVHYEKYLGDVVYRYVIDDSDLPRKIQLLLFKNVFSGCTTFTTLGLSSYSDRFGGRFFEFVVVVDDFVENMPKLIFSVIRTIISDNVAVEWGSCIFGLSDIDPDFVASTGKNVFYFTLPSPFPSQFEFVETENIFLKNNKEQPKLFMGLFISDLEKQYLNIHGKYSFEKKLEMLEVDPMSVRRGELF